MDDFDILIDKVRAQKTVIDSATALLKGLKERLAALLTGGQPSIPAQKIADLQAAISDSTQELANAVAENTPAE